MDPVITLTEQHLVHFNIILTMMFTLLYLRGFRLQFCIFTYGAEPYLSSRQLCRHSRSSQNFMEPKGSIPCSQELSTGPYPEPYQSHPLYCMHLSYSMRATHVPLSLLDLINRIIFDSIQTINLSNIQFSTSPVTSHLRSKYP
jgi:hypothetical protein